MKGTSGKPNKQPPPRQAATQLPKNPITKILYPHKKVNKSTNTDSKNKTTARNYNRSTGLERSVSKHWGAQTGITEPQPRPQLFGLHEGLPQATKRPPRETNKSQTNFMMKQRWWPDSKTLQPMYNEFVFWKMYVLSIFYQLFAFLLPKLHAGRYVYIVYISQTKFKVTSLIQDILGVDIFAQ